MSLWRVGRAIALMAILSRSVLAQVAGHVVVTGVVRDSAGGGIQGATIRSSRSGEAGVSDRAGRFRLVLRDAGRSTVTVLHMMHLRSERIVVPSVGDSLHLEFVLARRVQQVAGVRVVGSDRRDAYAIGRPAMRLSGTELERRAGSTLAQTLASEPGIHSRTQGPAAAMPIVRGMTGDRITILQDGMRTGDLASTAPDHGVTIDPLAARDVELLRGPAALVAGNSALGGVVDVRSFDVPGSVPERAMVSIALSGETASEGGGVQLEATQPLGGSTALRMRLGARSHDEMRLVGGTPLANTSMRNTSQAIALARDGARADSRVALRRYAFEYGLPFRDDPASGVRLRGRRHEASARSDLRPRRGLAGLRVEATSQWYEHDEVNVDGSVGTALGLRTHQGQITAVTDPGPLGTVTFGGSFLMRRNDVQGSQALTPPNASDIAAIFAHRAFESSVGTRRITFPVAFRLERSAIRSDRSERFGEAVHRSFTELSAAGGMVVPIGRVGAVEATLARGVRPPTPEELFSRAGHAGTGAFEIGNPALSAERSQGAELGARLFAGRWRGSVSAYANHVAGWIGVYPAGRDTVINAGGIVKTLPLMVVSQRDARIRGLEASIETWMRNGVTVTMTGDVLRARDSRGEALPFMPAARVGVALRWEGGPLEVGGGARHAFAQGAVPAGEFAASGYTFAEAHATWHLTRGSGGHSVTLRAENLGDAAWRDATSRVKDFAPGRGRNVSLSYRMDVLGPARGRRQGSSRSPS